jgi:hypothetical protein
VAGMLDVDIALLRTLGSDLTAVADAVAGLDGRSGLAGVPSGLAGADSARVAAGAGARVEAAVKAVGARVRTMATAASSGASTYEAADMAFADALKSIGPR